MKYGCRAHDYGCFTAQELAKVLANNGYNAAQLAMPKAIQGIKSLVDVTPEQLAARSHGVEHQAAAKAHKEDKQPIAQQMKTAQKQAEEHRGQTAPKKSAPRRDER